MKKILLILVAVMAAMTVSARQTAIFKGVKASGSWASHLSLDASKFANLSAGDVLSVKWTNDTEGAEAAGEDWIQISVCDGSWSTYLVNSGDAKFIKSLTFTLTSEQVTAIKTNGLAVGGHFVNITDVMIGDAYATSAVEHWDGSAWSTADFVMPSGWASTQLNNDNLKGANIGDCITVSFTHEGGIGEWDAQLQIVNADGWTNLIAIPAGTSNSLSLMVDESNYAVITAGDVRLSGCNLTITDVQLETTDLYFALSHSATDVDLSKLSTVAPVNIDLTRKIDWNTTICLPFDVDDPYTAFGHEGAFYSLKEYNSGLVFTPASTLEAGKPYYATFNMSGIAEEDKTMTFSFDAVSINTTLTPSAEVSGLTMKGNYTPGMSMTNKYGVACVYKAPDWVWAFYKGGSNTYLPAFSAYIEGTLSASRLDIVFEDGDVTGLTEVRGLNEEVEDYYNLNGQRVVQPTKGLYIVNGKKVIK